MFKVNSGMLTLHTPRISSRRVADQGTVSFEGMKFWVLFLNVNLCFKKSESFCLRCQIKHLLRNQSNLILPTPFCFALFFDRVSSNPSWLQSLKMTLNSGSLGLTSQVWELTGTCHHLEQKTHPKGHQSEPSPSICIVRRAYSISFVKNELN